jgi:hypothetical protein
MGTITRNAANNFTTGGVILPAAINDASVASLTELENVAAGGAMNLISEQTASGSASIEFTTGIDSTYPIYKFEFINMHPASNSVNLQVNFRDGGSSYDATKTTTAFIAHHAENDAYTEFAYDTGADLAQSTGSQKLVAATSIGSDNDQSLSGYLHLFNPSSTTFVKHFIARTNTSGAADSSSNTFIAGYCNVTAAIDGVQFDMSSGNIDSGTIKLYGISGS